MGGNDVPAVLPFQQLPVPVPSQARSTTNAGEISPGSGCVPLPWTRLRRTRVRTGKRGARMRAGHG